MIGQTISHYKVLEKLGEGGMGIVYKAQDLKLDRSVALKFLPPHLAASEADKARFVQEAKAASSLNHPNILTIYDFDEWNGQSFIAMELVEGHSLKSEIKDRQSSGEHLPLDQIIEYGIQIAEGLAKAHEKGIIHRDVKSDNIMLTKDSRAKIMDFGLAKLRSGTGLTRTGSTLGTVAYMSPEQMQGEIVDNRSDIWSFGVVLYEMLTGQLPFMGEHEAAIIYSVVHLEPQRPTLIRPEIPKDLEELITLLLQKDRDQRPNSCGEIAERLKNTRTDSTAGSGSTLHQHVSRPASGPKISKTANISLVLKIALSLIVVVIAVGLYLTLRSNMVKGTIAVSVRDKQGKPIANASVGIEPGSGSAVFFDPSTNQKSRGKLRANTGPQGDITVSYEVPPATTLAILVSAEGYFLKASADTLLVHSDSSIALSYALEGSGPNVVTVFVRDHSNNPVETVTGVLVGASGKRHKFSVDQKGRATIPFSAKTEGTNPRVELSFATLGPSYGQSAQKAMTISSGMQLDIDVNDFFPYDNTVQDLIAQSRYLIKEREWKKAIEPLQRLVTLRARSVTPEANVLLAEALFEKDDDNYGEVVKLLDKVLPERSNLSSPGSEHIVETMYYYRVRALYKAYDNLKKSDPSRQKSKDVMLKACNEYKDLFRFERFKALQQEDKLYGNHLDDVLQIQNK